MPQREFTPEERTYWSEERPKTHDFPNREQYFQAVAQWHIRKTAARMGPPPAIMPPPWRSGRGPIVNGSHWAMPRSLPPDPRGGPTLQDYGLIPPDHVTGTEIEARQWREAEALRSIRDNVQMVVAAHQQAVASSIYGYGILSEGLQWGAPPIPAPREEKPKLPDPRIAAERLLRTVLPDDLCVSLSAINQCEVTGKSGFTYTLKKGGKTHCKKLDGAVYSCCIEFAPGEKKPDVDRIVAEYMLITSDEQEYLKTANLSRISTDRYPDFMGPAYRPSSQAFWTNQRPAADSVWTGYDPGRDPHAHIPRPAQIRTQAETVAQSICDEMWRFTFETDQFRGRRFPVLNHRQIEGQHRIEIVSAEANFETYASPAYVRDLCLRPAAQLLQREMSVARMTIVGFTENIARGSAHSTVSSHDGKSIVMAQALDLRSNQMLTRFMVGCVTVPR